MLNCILDKFETIYCGKDFVLGESLFGGAKLATNADPDKYRGSGFSIWFDTRRSFP